MDNLYFVGDIVLYIDNYIYKILDTREIDCYMERVEDFGIHNSVVCTYNQILRKLTDKELSKLTTIRLFAGLQNKNSLGITINDINRVDKQIKNAIVNAANPNIRR